MDRGLSESVHCSPQGSEMLLEVWKVCRYHQFRRYTRGGGCENEQLVLQRT